MRFGLGSFTYPKAGLFPFLVGLVIILIAVILFITAKPKKVTPIIGVRWKNLLLVLVSLIFYPLALNWLGFPMTNLLFMIFILKVIEPQRWSVTLMVAVLSTSFIYLVFSLWLKVDFPKGIVGW
jgi:putative tricarboxylic transport membrane protein